MLNTPVCRPLPRLRNQLYANLVRTLPGNSLKGTINQNHTFLTEFNSKTGTSQSLQGACLWRSQTVVGLRVRGFK